MLLKFFLCCLWPLKSQYLQFPSLTCCACLVLTSTVTLVLEKDPVCSDIECCTDLVGDEDAKTTSSPSLSS